MGAITSLRIDDYEFISTKNEVIPELMIIFSESDRRMRERSPAQEDVAALEEAETSEDVEYASTVRVIRDRLEVMGFSLAAVKREFEELRQERLAELEEDLDESPFEFLHEEYEVLRSASFDDFLRVFSQLKLAGLTPYSASPAANDPRDRLVRFVLREDNGWYLGFPASDLRAPLRVFLEVSPEDAPVVQDVTELIDSGYYPNDVRLVDFSRTALTSDYPRNTPVLILTEGSFDSEVIRRSMRLLYPHLIEYYSFMLFSEARAGGGAPVLASTVKGFVGARIANRVIAIFDNDTAARSALRALDGLFLPAHIRVMRLPNIDLARHYPTIGPTGTVELDVNGLAGSLELYLGRDVLEESGQFIPVQWRGFDSALREYQGEVLNKASVQERFLRKLARCEQDPASLQDSQWTEIRVLLQLIFRAFA